MQFDVGMARAMALRILAISGADSDRWNEEMWYKIRETMGLDPELEPKE